MLMIVIEDAHGQRSLELSSEIKELDSDMQMLVYENYNKFISATETIQQMKAKVSLSPLILICLCFCLCIVAALLSAT